MRSYEYNSILSRIPAGVVIFCKLPGHMLPDGLGNNHVLVCLECGKVFSPGGYGKNAGRAMFCSKTCKGLSMRKRISKTCPICGRDFSCRSSGEANNRKRVYCSNTCAAKYRSSLPGRMELFEATIGPKRGTGKMPEHNYKNSEHMKRNWADPAYRARVLPSYQGKTFLSRGGNGQPTKPQLILADLTGLPMEYPIPTASVRDRFISLPHCYKVDLADPDAQLAIEVDGRTHDQPKWKFLDQRKTEVLNALGWTVVRFKNEEVLANPDAVVLEIEKLRKSKE